MKDELRAWSVETFGHAKLGDERRLRRLVQMGVRAAERPDGRLSTVFGSAREREGAYDFVENRAIKEEALGKAIHGAAARSGSVHPLVFVPVDGTSINLSDRAGKKDFGSIGTYKSKATGLKVINALVLSPDGVPLGLGAQAWWKRPRKKVSKRHHMRLPVEAKETQHYLRALNQVSDAFKEHAPRTKPWFQIDREGVRVTMELQGEHRVPADDADRGVGADVERQPVQRAPRTWRSPATIWRSCSTSWTSTVISIWTSKAIVPW